MPLKRLKEFNYKQFFFDHGERIGLGVAGFLALLLLLPLFWPGSGFLAPSAGGNAAALNKLAENVENGLQHNQPGPADKPGDTKDKLVAFNFDVISDKTAKDYMIADVFDGSRPGGGGRQMPDLLAPKESDIALVRFQMPALIYRNDYEALLALKGAPAGGMSSGPGSPGPGNTNSGAGGPPMGSGGGPPAGMKGMYGGMMSGSGAYGAGRQLGNQTNPFLKKNRGRLIHGKPGEGEDDKDFTTDWVKLDKATSLSGETLAEQVFPVRAAEVVAAFPYKDQVREFQDKLHLPSDLAVLNELSQETGKDNQPLRAFRFLGVKVERREVGADDKPAADDKGQWAAIDLDGAYKPLIVASGISGEVQHFQPEDPRLAAVIFPGLVLPKLPTFGERRTPPVDPYPKEEDLLPSLKTTLDTLSKSPDAQVARPSFTQVQDNIFDLGAAAASQQPGGANGFAPGMPGPGNTGTPTGPGARPGGTNRPTSPMAPGGPMFPGSPGGFTPRPGGTSRPGGPTPDGMPSTGPGAGAQGVVPDVCLIRLFDFTVEPGKTYEYRLQVRMANPNFGRKDSASQGYADAKELPVKDWYVLPRKLVVPTDSYYYAVDQVKLDAAAPKDKDKEKDKGPKLPVLLVKEGQTVLQLQRWVDDLQPRNRGENLPIGDWVIAERAMAWRGEPIGRQRVEVPYWRTAQARFTMYADAPVRNPKRDVASADVPFAPEGQEPILVDFRGGDVTYTRTHPKTDDNAAPSAEPPISDKAPEEALLYTFDGKLLALDSARDAVDADRVKRLKEYRDWIKEVKEAKSGGKEGSSPFGNPGGSNPP